MPSKHPCQHDDWANWMRQTIYAAFLVAGIEEPNGEDINRWVYAKSAELKAIKDNHIGEGDIFRPLLAAVIREARRIVEEASHAE